MLLFVVQLWKNARRICCLGFRKSALIEFLPLINRNTEIFLNQLRSNQSKALDIQPLCHLIAIDILFGKYKRYSVVYHEDICILETTTNQRQNFQENDTQEFLKARNKYIDIIGERLYSPILMNEFFFKLFKKYEEMTNAVQILKIMTNKILRIAKNENTEYYSIDKCKHLIDIFLAYKMEDVQMASLVNTFTFAASKFRY